MPDVQLPDGSTVTFPEGMPPAQMNTALAQFWSQKQASQPAPAAPTAQQASDKAYGKQGTASDIASAALDAPPKALAGLLGIFGDVQTMRDHAIDYLMRHAEALGRGKDVKDIPTMLPDSLAQDRMPTSGEVRGVMEKAIGQPLYEPQGEAARVVGRVVEGASVPGARIAGAVGGVTGETGRLIAGTPGDIVGSLAGGGLTGLAQALTGTPEKVLRNALENVTDAQLQQADALVKAAAAKGTPITGAEAISQVTGGNVRLQDLQRVLERTAGGAGATEPIMQARPAANAAAMQSDLAKVAPPITQPSEIAPRVQAAASDTINGTRQAINTVTAPLYSAASANTVPDAVFNALKGNTMFQAALKQVRADPVYGSLASMPDNSVAVIDAVKKQLGSTAESFQPNPLQPHGNAGHEAAYTSAADQAKNAAIAGSPVYGAAVGTQDALRSALLDPLRRSATGQLSAAEKFPQQASVLFNPKPLEGSENEVGSAVKSVAAKDPEAAQQMVRAYLKQQFDELTQKLSGGPNQFGGAGFAASVAGNVQQAKNLAAALKALPNGDEIAGSFGNLLKIFEAQGMRARPGSATSFNAEVQAQLAKGGKVAELLETATSPSSWLKLGKDVGQRILYERNSAKLAEILTSPDSVQQMRQIAKIDPQSAAAKALYRSLVPTAVSQTQQ